MVNHYPKYCHPSSKIWPPIFPRITTQRVVTHNLKHGHPLTKLNKILQNLKKLQPNLEFDTSAAKLVFYLLTTGPRQICCPKKAGNAKNIFFLPFFSLFIYIKNDLYLYSPPWLIQGCFSLISSCWSQIKGQDFWDFGWLINIKDTQSYN